MIRSFTLWRYISRLFFVAIAATLAVCALLIFMIDFVELLRQSSKFGSVPMGTLVMIAMLRLGAYVEFLLGFARFSSARSAPFSISTEKANLRLCVPAGCRSGSSWDRGLPSGLSSE